MCSLKNVKKYFLLSFAALLFTQPLFVAAKNGVAATVNGVVISDSTLDDAVKLASANAKPQDLVKFRQAILDQLIAREIMVQESGKLGIDKSPDVQKQLINLRKNLLIESLIQQFVSKNPVADADVKSEYDRQVKLLAQTPQKELRVYAMVFANETDAQSALQRVKGGESFERVAKEKSTGLNKENGGDMGWVLPKNAIPALTNPLSSMTKGNISSAPIKSKLGWLVVKAEDERTFKMPGFEEVKNKLKQDLITQKIVGYTAKLKETAKIVVQ